MKNSANVIRIRPYTSPCGTLLLGSYHDSLCLCDWVESRHPGRTRRRLQSLLGAECVEADSHVLREAARQLDDYFAHGRTRFDLPLLWVGSDFQKKVWQALLGIPYGQTISYKELAIGIGAPSAVRAVANANGANALSIIVPCHRVVGADHSLTGYAGGLAAKKFLLKWEQNGEPGAFGTVL